MKTLNTITLSAVLVVPFCLATPARSSDWIYIGKTNENVTFWVKPKGCNEDICDLETKWSAFEDTSHLKVDCSSEKWKFADEKSWKDIQRHTMFAFGAREICEQS